MTHSSTFLWFVEVAVRKRTPRLDTSTVVRSAAESFPAARSVSARFVVAVFVKLPTALGRTVIVTVAEAEGAMLPRVQSTVPVATT